MNMRQRKRRINVPLLMLKPWGILTTIGICVKRHNRKPVGRVCIMQNLNGEYGGRRSPQQLRNNARAIGTRYNMDFFGIGAAMRGMLFNYRDASRHTGRTVSMLESVKSGDRIVFTNEREAERVSRLLKEDFQVDVECRVCSPRDPHELFGLGTPQGRTIFDHTWVEEYYAHAVETALADIDKLQQSLSGYGEAHRETRRKAIELSKWRY